MEPSNSCADGALECSLAIFLGDNVTQRLQLKFFKCIQAKLLHEDALREMGGNLLSFCGLKNYIILLIASFTSNGGTRVCTGSEFYEEAMYINA